MRFMMLMIPKGYEKAAPGAMPDAKAVIEVRQVQELSDFPADVQEVAAKFPEMQAHSRKRRGS